jgi:SPP1 family predicted phage head-tail adaptor
MFKRLPHSISIQKPTITRGSAGGQVKSWSEFASVLAFVKPLHGREFFSAQQAQAETTHKIMLWYLPGVTSEMRVIFGNRVLEIASPPINIDERGIELQLMCVDKGETV